MNDILMIAYHFPPCGEVSGSLRTLALARYLGEEGLQPHILTVNPIAYPLVDATTLRMIPKHCKVVRAFALDVRRHLGIGGRYPMWLAQPDRWSSWWFGAMPLGLRLIRQYNPRVIWSTYPTATAHLIAYSLHRLTGIPWIADFRDPVRPPIGQEQSFTARNRARLDRLTIAEADACVFVTEGAKRVYEERYKNQKHGIFNVIQNGYDEDSFAHLGTTNCIHNNSNGRPLVLVHSGVLYPYGRNPEPLFQALSNLLSKHWLKTEELRVILRASGSEIFYSEMLSKYHLREVVRLAPQINHAAALEELFQADGLLVFQGSAFNTQIPAKIYEYFRVGKPILGLVDKTGDTARLIEREKAGITVDINNYEAIEAGLIRFIDWIREGSFLGLNKTSVLRYSRQQGAIKLMDLINKVTTFQSISRE